MINQPSEFLKIHKIISSRNLNESFKLLRSKASSVADHKLFDKVVSLEETYNYMINYFVNGYEDAGRENMLEQIINELHSLADLLHRESLIDDSISPYFAQIRTDRLSNISLEERIDKYGSAHEERLLVETSGSYDQDIAKNEEIALADLFLKIWISDPLSKSERNNIEHILLHSDDYILKCQIISAMMLGGMQYFDSSKLDILLTVYNSCFDSVSIKARSLTAAIAIILSHIDRVRDLKDIFKKIDSQDFGIIFLNFIRTRETDSITDKMNNDVIPELMKLQPKIVKRFKDASKEIDINDLESNPEWEEIIDKSGINDTMRELTEMQSEGSDVMMFAFSNLKKFRFFNNIYNWFLPYNPNHSELSKLRDMNISALDTMLTSTDFLCDSDKYSFVLSILAVPEAQQQAMTSQLNMQFSQSKSDIDDRRLTTPRGDFKIEVVKYVRDIYRFMRLYSHKEFFNDLFSMKLDENLLSCINEKLMESDSYILLGEFLFKKKFYSEAILVFTDLAKSNSESHILEKLGFCYQSQGLISRALEYYKRAEITNPDNLWLLKKCR
jgi:tetratricopeptide (TPR) repeat protein